MSTRSTVRSLGRVCSGLLCATTLAVAAPLTAHSQQTDADSTHAAVDQLPALVLMVDGSGSMWGGLGSDGTSKLNATTAAIKALLPEFSRTRRIGLSTFGPGCRTAAMDVAPTQNNQPEINAALDKFNPRGKGPIAAGLQAASETFSEAEAGDIVLIHDGLDNCGADVCAMAASIHAAKPDLKISTISIELNEADSAAIACVSQATGGYAFNAKTPSGVRQALTEIAKQIETPGSVSPKQAAVTPSAAKSQNDQAATGPPRLIAAAKLVAGGKQASTPLSWRIMEADGGRVIHETVAPSIVVPLEPGVKIVEASSGKISVSEHVEIKPVGGTNLDLILDAGIVRFDTGAKRLASDADEPLIRLDAFETQTQNGTGDPDPAGATPLWIARGKAIEALLPPGEYRAVARYGLAAASARVTVTAGADLNLTLPLEAGRLELKTRPAGTKDVVYRISVDDTERPGGRREIAFSAYAQPSFVLSTGSYYVTATSGAETIQRVVAVRSGDVSSEEFVFGLAKLQVAATLNGAGLGQQPLSLTIQRQDSEGARSLEPPDLQPVSPGEIVSLLAATYRITLRYGLYNARIARSVRLEPGASEKIAMDLKTSEIQLDTTASDGTMTGAVCTLRSQDGAIVWRTVKARSHVVVDPQTYSFNCKAGKMLREVSVTTAAGQITRVTPFAISQQ